MWVAPPSAHKHSLPPVPDLTSRLPPRRNLLISTSHELRDWVNFPANLTRCHSVNSRTWWAISASSSFSSTGYLRTLRTHRKPQIFQRVCQLCSEISASHFKVGNVPVFQRNFSRKKATLMYLLFSNKLLNSVDFLFDHQRVHSITECLHYSHVKHTFKDTFFF